MKDQTAANLKNHLAEIDRQYLANVRHMHTKMTQLLQAQQQATEELMAIRERVRALHLAMLNRSPAHAPKPSATVPPARLAKLPPTVLYLGSSNPKDPGRP